MPETPNHSYNVPDEGAQDWHIPLNENFRQYDTDIELRGPQSELTSNQPKDGAKFLATDTGRIYVGDGSRWVWALALPRVDPATVVGAAASLVLGSPVNSADADGAVVAGGGSAGGPGSPAQPNGVTGAFGVVSGGVGNTVSAEEGVVGGGEFNRAQGDYATVGGGAHNVASKIGATVGGGGGRGGPTGNAALAQYATIAGGSTNIITDASNYSTVGGGHGNAVESQNGTIGGGGATDTSNQSTVADTGNLVSGAYGTVGGGGNNQAGVDDSNPNTGAFATVSGGNDNEASAFGATIAGGSSNVADGQGAAVGGGENNTASGPAATVGGGAENNAAGEYSFAAGRRANADEGGAFVWGDSSDRQNNASAPDEFSVQAGGGVTIYSSSDFSTGVVMGPGEGTWNSLSTRTAKTGIEPIDPPTVLEKVERLSIDRWEYDGDSDATHMGPMAEEFHDAFGLGSDERRIATVDADGVALAAIQGLAEELDAARERVATQRDRLDEQADRIDDLEAENEALRERLAAVERRLDADGEGDEGPADAPETGSAR